MKTNSVTQELKNFLDKKVLQYEKPEFIKGDPICIPHAYSNKQDIEISGLFAAIFSWGNRTTIINKSRELMELMDDQPYQFITSHQDADLKRLLNFRHRTFNTTDLLYFIQFLSSHYDKHESLETAFLAQGDSFVSAPSMLSDFYNNFFSLEDAPLRTSKHISTPERRSACKRINMYLRWMVRNSKHGVDFGIWKTIKPRDLICPLDVHVARVARHFNLLKRNQTDWEAAQELTDHLKILDPTDPVKYDFALFGLGVLEKF